LLDAVHAPCHRFLHSVVSSSSFTTTLRISTHDPPRSAPSKKRFPPVSTVEPTVPCGAVPPDRHIAGRKTRVVLNRFFADAIARGRRRSLVLIRPRLRCGRFRGIDSDRVASSEIGVWCTGVDQARVCLRSHWWLYSFLCCRRKFARARYR
jgi:hypothetical protein